MQGDSMNIKKFFRRLLVNQKYKANLSKLKKMQDQVVQSSPSLVAYNDKMKPFRQEMEGEINHLYTRIKSEQEIMLYLIFFSSIGAKMVKPAPDWLRTWGAKIKNEGFAKIGEEITGHADEEVGHDKWHERDVKYLVGIYNQRFAKKLNVEDVLRKGAASCVNEYVNAFERSCAPNRSCTALGMLYETELMTFTLAPQFIGYCVQELGFGALKGMSFLQGHLVSDIEHVNENMRQMQEILDKQTDPEMFNNIVQCGYETIQVYRSYFRQTMELVSRELNSENNIAA
jgi:hypothetical protein